jgi:hypothetical protein
MGAVKKDVYNSGLMNMANYKSIRKLKLLLGNMNNLLKIAEAGDSVAACIYIDLKDALNHPALTEKQRDCIVMKFIYKYTNKDITEALNVKSDNSARKHIEGGLKKMRKILGGD